MYVGEKSMLVKNFGNVGEEYVSEANIPFHQHTISTTYLHQHTVFTNIRVLKILLKGNVSEKSMLVTDFYLVIKGCIGGMYVGENICW